MFADPRTIHNLRTWERIPGRYAIDVPYRRHTAQIVILETKGGWYLVLKPPGREYEFIQPHGGTVLHRELATLYQTPEQAAMEARKYVLHNQTIQRGYDLLQGKGEKEVREPLPQFGWLRSLTATERHQAARVAARYLAKRSLG